MGPQEPEASKTTKATLAGWLAGWQPQKQTPRTTHVFQMLISARREKRGKAREIQEKAGEGEH